MNPNDPLLLSIRKRRADIRRRTHIEAIICFSILAACLLFSLLFENSHPTP